MQCKKTRIELTGLLIASGRSSSKYLPFAKLVEITRICRAFANDEVARLVGWCNDCGRTHDVAPQAVSCRMLCC